MGIFDIFRRKKVEKIQENVIEENETGIYFHEDTFNQVEFLPRENKEYLESENEKIENFAVENFDGHGFKDIYVRDESPKTIADKKIDFEELDRILLSLGLEKVSEVYEGYGSAKWKCENTFAYIFDGAEIFVSLEDNFVHDFWVDGFRFHENDETKSKLKSILFKIGNEMDLILNDWDLTVVIDLKDESEIEKYLNEEF
ncbi:hypothetical protein [Flavobacterium phycosphaerae]|uniref:hypothetical protein n=1 Tax=Flavobacterium phycosphaerae TaxID=2697515 RepID=UPI001389E72C|nr:hypothetical protein [Flavobacterium phycosphaerae]